MANLTPLDDRSMIATLFPLPFIALDPRQEIAGSRVAAVVFAFVGPTLMHQFVGNYVEPKVFGNKFHMHPVTVLVALAFWGLIWGIPGGILSVPLTAAVHIILKEIKHPWAATASCLIEGNLDAIYKHLGHRRSLPAPTQFEYAPSPELRPEDAPVVDSESGLAGLAGLGDVEQRRPRGSNSSLL